MLGRVATRLVAPFLTGLAFLAPVILTVLLLNWLGSYVVGAFGPGSFLGRAIASGGRAVTGADVGEAAAFWIGAGLLCAAITALGLAVQTRAKAALESWFDRLLGRVPVLGSLYRPVAQMVRTLKPGADGELKSMAPVCVRLGGVDVLALLASPRQFDLGNGPRRLVLVPTAPVPVGGALLFVPSDDVTPVDMRVDELARLYVSMGAAVPDSWAALHPEARPG